MSFSLSECSCFSEFFKNIVFSKVLGLRLLGVLNLVRYFRSKISKSFAMPKPYFN